MGRPLRVAGERRGSKHFHHPEATISTSSVSEAWPAATTLANSGERGDRGGPPGSLQIHNSEVQAARRRSRRRARSVRWTAHQALPTSSPASR